MTPNEYQQAALRTSTTIDPQDLLINGALGLAGESGEVCDIVKKFRFQGHELDRSRVAEEISDCLWYIAITAKAIGYTLEEVMQLNVDKLLKRYPNGFEAARSVNRP